MGCGECGVEDHQVWSQKQNRPSVYRFNKCHCRVLEREKLSASGQWERIPLGATRGLSQGERIRVQYMSCEQDIEWIEDPTRVPRNRDERWCSHGRYCNRMARHGCCEKRHLPDFDCKFCHDPSCVPHVFDQLPEWYIAMSQNSESSD